MKRKKSVARTSKRIIHTLAVVLIIAGICLAAYPFLEAYYNRNFKTPEPTITAVPDPAPDTAAEAAVEVYPEKLPEGAEGVLEIPKLNLQLNVGYDVTEEALKKGPGFFPQSGYPDTGNVCIAGHRNAYGSPFWYLDKMEPGDEIHLTYNGYRYSYQVERNYVTDPHDWSIVDPTEKPAITLQTCTPLYPVNGQYDRLIIRGYLVSKEKLPAE